MIVLSFISLKKNASKGRVQAKMSTVLKKHYSITSPRRNPMTHKEQQTTKTQHKNTG